MTRLVRLLLVSAVLLATAGCSSRAPRSAPLPADSSPPVATIDDDPTEDGPGVAANTPAPRSAVLAARDFVRAWARPDLAQGTWFAAVQKLVTPGYAQLLNSTDPTNVPAHAVTGDPQVVSSTTAVVITDVPTDGGVVRVAVVNAGRWLVATASPAPGPP